MPDICYCGNEISYLLLLYASHSKGKAGRFCIMARLKTETVIQYCPGLYIYHPYVIVSK